MKIEYDISLSSNNNKYAKLNGVYIWSVCTSEVDNSTYYIKYNDTKVVHEEEI